MVQTKMASALLLLLSHASDLVAGITGISQLSQCAIAQVLDDAPSFHYSSMVAVWAHSRRAKKNQLPSSHPGAVPSSRDKVKVFG
ncbi:MAG TPA: hypothetical protein VKX49_02465 [Bryobacteraceae bacterium]|nr:hypothetical protein [Bryobacteraceae bacterium]